jgi:hypothetical protein
MIFASFCSVVSLKLSATWKIQLEDSTLSESFDEPSFSFFSQVTPLRRDFVVYSFELASCGQIAIVLNVGVVTVIISEDIDNMFII